MLEESFVAGQAGLRPAEGKYLVPSPPPAKKEAANLFPLVFQPPGCGLLRGLECLVTLGGDALPLWDSVSPVVNEREWVWQNLQG